MARFHYRLPLCPSYDFLALEGWLEEKAEKGLLLDKDGYVFGFFQFQKDTPRKVRYRLEANVRHSPLDLNAPEDPSAEAVALNEEFGWEYWGQYRDYDIYRTENPDARELNTDPVVQAMALDAVRKRTGFSLTFLVLIVAGILLGFLGAPDLTLRAMSHEQMEGLTRYILMAFCVLFGIAYLFREQKGGKVTGIASKMAVLILYLGAVLAAYRSADSLTPLLDILNQGWLWWLAYGGLILSCLGFCLISYLHIVRLQRQLRRGEGLARDGRQKKGRIPGLIFGILPFVLLFSLPFARSYSGRPDTSVPIENFSQKVPFATMAELAPEREYVPAPKNGSNTLRFWSDILSPVNYDWHENAYLDAPDGSRYAGTLSIIYHEAANEAIARRLILEYAGTRQPDDSLIPDSIDPSEFDFLGIYENIHPTILLRKGNIVICTYCSVQSWGDHVNLYPVWLERMANLI